MSDRRPILYLRRKMCSLNSRRSHFRWHYRQAYARNTVHYAGPAYNSGRRNQEFST